LVQVIATTQFFNQLTLFAWVKVFRITAEFCIFSLLRGNFSESCKSCEFSGRGGLQGSTSCWQYTSYLHFAPTTTRCVSISHVITFMTELLRITNSES